MNGAADELESLDLGLIDDDDDSVEPYDLDIAF
jgi:hypothetical protein